jgi:DHA2 family multidrug resistance protein-like MFS transporter
MSDAPPRGAAAPETAATASKLAFLPIAMATACTVIDGVSITLALPAIAESFGVGPGRAALVLTVAQLVMVALILPFSALGDRYGYRLVFVTSLAVAFPATVAAIVAPDLGWLLAARVVQAAGLAGVMSVNFALVRTVYPARQVGRGVARLASTVAIAFAVGPVLAGLILAIASWHWILGMLLPLQLGAIVAALLLLPAASPRGAPPDVVAAVMSAFMMAALVMAPVAISGGWPPVTALAALAVSVVAFLLLRLRLRDDPAPVFPFDLFRIPAFAGGIAASVAMFAAQFAAFVGLPFLFLDELGLSPAVTGLLFSTWPAVVAVAAPVYGRLADRISVRPLCIGSLAVMLLGLALLAAAPASAGPLDLAWRMAVCGLGFAGFQTPNNRLLVAVTPARRSAAASGTMATARQLGRALGVAAAAMLLTLPFGDARAILWLAVAFAGLAMLASFLREGDQGAAGDEDSDTDF